jgi:hypothetical protein
MRPRPFDSNVFPKTTTQEETTEQAGTAQPRNGEGADRGMRPAPSGVHAVLLSLS